LGRDPSIQTVSPLNNGNRTIILIITSLATLSVSFMASSFHVALPVIGREFGTDVVLLSWIVSAYVLAIAVFLVPLGRISDIFGLKAVFSNSTVMLIVLRMMQGLGAAMIAGTSTAIVTAIFPPKERGRALGIHVAFVYTGGSIGPFLGGILTEHLGWRSIFVFNVVFSLLVIVFLLWKVKGEWRASRGDKFDYIGAIIYACTLILLMYGFSLLPEIRGIILIAVGVTGLLAFLKWENRVSSPVLNLSLFRHNNSFAFSSLSILIHYSATFALSFLIILYLQYVKGLSPSYAGLMMIAQPVMQAALSPFTGRLSDKIEPRLVAASGMAITCAGLIFFIFISESTPVFAVPICLAVVGVGFALFTSPISNSLMSSVQPKFFGLASAIMSTMRTIGQTFSMGITTIVFATVIGRVVITPEYHEALLSSTRIVFSVFTVLCFGAIFVVLVKSKQPKAA
jgi:MFS family permease